MKIGRLNHVGVAVPSIAEAAQHYKEMFGATDITKTGEMPSQGVRYAFVNLPNSQIELIEPLGENSPIRKFLDKNPKGGQHHICYEVENIYETRDELVAKGAAVLGEPRIGAHGTLIIFVHPKDCNGILTELMEAPKADH